jgi:hypothetical protein
MAAGPGRIVEEFTDVIPKTRDADPIAAQNTPAFKQAVEEVGRAFLAAEGRATKKG